ncbi:TnsA-like heteromeric transposase endonuclease subunit [Nocardia gipuzkoensis]|uniref:TnsA-like heteromeric transposase endonuclease subunit n=1 Tax=Nocardia abscessus TaxID=120957 RepID=UPI001E59195A|nr:TnsA-like heteromeric transposase endonuclease subunit [Nocardia abscessus]
MDSTALDVDDGAEVAFRRAGREDEAIAQFRRVRGESLIAATPWRTFRWHYGQKHYSGTYWAATEAGHIIYESRLELARLLFADFDRSVKRIAAQPFLLRTTVDGRMCRHVPDFLLLTEEGPIVVDVKPAARLSVPAVQFTFEWTRRLVESRGWRYQVWTEPDAVELANIRFLAGYRRSWLFGEPVTSALRASVVSGMTVDEAVRSASEFPATVVRSGLLHLLWRQVFLVDVSQVLQSTSIIEVK